jgi:phage terminase small subunit
MLGVVVYVKLTPKQKAFCEYYIETGNALDSARRAGYKQPQIQGHENLEKHRIKSYIEERMKSKEEKRIMDADEALELLTCIARGEATETVVTPSGKKEIKEADINQRIKAIDSLMKRFNVVVDKTKTETEHIREKTKLLKGVSKDTSLMEALIKAVKDNERVSTKAERNHSSTI